MLDQLAQLSRDASGEGRRTLLNAVTDLFLVEDEPSEAMSDHYSFIAGDALERIDGTDRASYAERVAASANLPKAVATRLARDPEAAVACIVLKLSPVLSDADLASIAVTHSPQHLLAIAERPTLSANVTDILVERGEGEVLRTVSGNRGAQFSEPGMARLLRHAEADHEVLENLVQRHQLSSENAARLQRIASGLMPSDVNGTPFTAERRQAQARRLEVKLLVADVRSGTRSLDDVVRLLTADDRAFDLAQLIGTVAGIPDAQVLKVLLEFDVSGIAVACRSIGLSDEAFRAVLGLRKTRLRQADRQVERDAAAYAELPNDVSERAMRFLQVRLKMS